MHDPAGGGGSPDLSDSLEVSCFFWSTFIGTALEPCSFGCWESVRPASAGQREDVQACQAYSQHVLHMLCFLKDLLYAFLWGTPIQIRVQ